MAKITNAPQFTDLEAQLSKNVYTTTGPAPNFSVTIPNVKSYDDLTNKRISINFHLTIPYGASITLNVNGLGARSISNYDKPNLTWRYTTLPNYELSLRYTGVLFKAIDFGDTNTVSGASVDQVIGGFKTFTQQIISNNQFAFGIQHATGYFHTKETNPRTDTIGDTRLFNHSGTLNVQTCTTANATKGSGTWVTTGITATESQLPFETSFSTKPATPINIGTTPVDLTPVFGVGTKSSQGADLFTYDSTNKVIKFNDTSDKYTNFEIELRVNAFVFTGTTTPSQYVVYIARPDGTQATLPTSIPYIKLSNSSTYLTNAPLARIRVRVSGKNDLFVTQGFKIYAVKEVGNDLQLLAGQEQILLLLR